MAVDGGGGYVITFSAFRNSEQNAGNESLAVVLLLEDCDFLPQTRTARQWTLVSPNSCCSFPPFQFSNGGVAGNMAGSKGSMTYVPGFWSLNGRN
jgi:hypothetical protein